MDKKRAGLFIPDHIIIGFLATVGAHYALISLGMSDPNSIILSIIVGVLMGMWSAFANSD